MLSILVTGANANVGREVINYLQKRGAVFRTTTHKQAEAHADLVYFDYEKPETALAAFAGVDKLFLFRPPQIADAKKYFLPVIQAAKQQGVKHIVFLSLMGVEQIKIVPHAKIEQYVKESGIAYTFLRPSFFVQNLITQHGYELRKEHRIFVPVGKGRTSFIDVRDIGEVGGMSLLDDQHQNKAYTLTGSEALSYYEVAEILTEEVGYPIKYVSPSLLKFRKHELEKGTPSPFVTAMLLIYVTAWLGLASRVTPELENLLGRVPRTVKDFAHDYHAEIVGV